MSQLSTAPLLNPTIEVDNLNQKMLVKSQVQAVDFGFDDVSQHLQQDTMNIERMTWEKIASKNQLISNHKWEVGTDTVWMEIPITYDYLRKLMSLGAEVHTYTKFSRVLFSLKPTNNSLFQGLSILSFRTLPENVYLKQTFNIDDDSKAKSWQFRKMFIQPNDSNDINFFIPIIFPFSKFANNISSGTINAFRGEYFKNYTLGIIKIKTIVPLKTKSELLALNYTLSAQILDLQLAGIQVNVP